MLLEPDLQFYLLNLSTKFVKKTTEEKKQLKNRKQISMVTQIRNSVTVSKNIFVRFVKSEKLLTIFLIVETCK
ncbi:hypothetical protein BpHYR1_011361 [Brachionus plicatilis]|uniref:Uncharacterized protein n=1 Tax=Brachionus plicatilis TaxID=10195 RepID=A0A3M7SM31_BRAPC|nr:hypothetical protein BpHYR1_011361 [Brachionus plicatilis]